MEMAWGLFIKPKSLMCLTSLFIFMLNIKLGKLFHLYTLHALDCAIHKVNRTSTKNEPEHELIEPTIGDAILSRER